MQDREDGVYDLVPEVPQSNRANVNLLCLERGSNGTGSVLADRRSWFVGLGNLVER